MHFFKIILSIFTAVLFTACTSPKLFTNDMKIVKVYKQGRLYKTPDLDESLKNIEANVGDSIYIRIFKEENILELWVKVDDKYKLGKVYPICAYSGDLGPKLKQGDKQSPEGFYIIRKNQLKTRSKYHLAINIGFPNRYDKNHNRTGTYLMIHGKCSSTGCYAMGDSQIEEIFMMADNAFDNGTKSISVHIFPFKMTQENLDCHSGNRWYPFWKNLKLGYDIFERYRVVPIVKTSKKRYRFFMKKG